MRSSLVMVESEPPPDSATGKLVVSLRSGALFKVGRSVRGSKLPRRSSCRLEHTVSTLSSEQEVSISVGGEPAKIDASDSLAEKFAADRHRGGQERRQQEGADEPRSGASGDVKSDRTAQHDGPVLSIVFDASYHPGRMHESVDGLGTQRWTHVSKSARARRPRVKGRTDLENQLIETTGRLREGRDR